MDRTEEKLRERLARAKGGHRKVLQGRLDTMMAQREAVETLAPAPVAKKKASKKTSKKK